MASPLWPSALRPTLVLRLVLWLVLVPLPIAAQDGASQAASGARAELDDYRLAPGDVLLIEVFGESDLTTRMRVSDGGTISFPFLGQLSVAGLTTRAVERLVDSGLRGPYLVDPRVTATIAAYRPIFLNGEVRSPGSFEWGPGMTVRKAVALAGGLTDRASTRRVFLLPEGGHPEQDRLRVDLDHPLAPGAIVTIEQSFF